MVSPEQNFILECLRQLVFPDQPILNLDTATAAKLDWDEIIKTSQNGRIIGFIAYLLHKQKFLPLVPDQVQLLMMAVMLRNERENQVRKKQFQTINDILQQNSIPVIPLKGIALSRLVYKDIPFRTMGDVDLLIRPEDFNETQRVLRQAGFDDRYSMTINRWHDEILEIAAGNFEGPYFLGKKTFVGKAFDVDVHYNPKFHIKQRYVTTDYEAVWARASPDAGWDSNIYLPSPLDQIWFLLLHMTGGPVPTLAQILDVALTMRTSNITGADIRAHMPITLDSIVKNAVENQLAMLQDIFDWQTKKTLPRSTALSSKTVKMLEPFFSSATVPVSFFVDLKTIPSLRLRLLYVAGYFFPNPNYYPLWEKGKVIGYLRYLQRRRERLQALLVRLASRRSLKFEKGTGGTE
jgi:hypothetical protein